MVLSKKIWAFALDNVLVAIRPESIFWTYDGLVLVNDAYTRHLAWMS